MKHTPPNTPSGSLVSRGRATSNLEGAANDEPRRAKSLEGAAKSEKRTWMTKYEETIEYLFNSTPVFEKIGAGAYKEGLQNTWALDEHLGHPHRQFVSIHVAGTNGKGSVSHTLAAILQAAGYRVGLYTSPHLVDFRERIRVNGQCVSEQFVIDFVEEHRAFFEPLHPSFFELTTVMAFKYFAVEHIDIAVVEVGLGGRLDCTNILSPILSIITNISLDHTQFLGNTLESIAGEKAGIIKSGTPVVIGETLPETRDVFLKKALEQHTPIFFADEERHVLSSQPTTDGGLVYDTDLYGSLQGELGGWYQERNTNTILSAVEELKKLSLHIDEQAVREGFAKVGETTGLMGRWQVVSDQPKVVCDTGHNAGGWAYLSEQLKKQPCRQMHIVFGMVDDKDIDTVMTMLPQDAIYYFTRPSNKRGIDEQRTADIGAAHGLHGQAYHTVSAAFFAAKSAASADDFIFVGGSSYLVADFLKDVCF